MATHSSILAWRIPRTEEPGRLQSIGSQGGRQNWSYLACPQAYGIYICQSQSQGIICSRLCNNLNWKIIKYKFWTKLFLNNHGKNQYTSHRYSFWEPTMYRVLFWVLFGIWKSDSIVFELSFVEEIKYTFMFNKTKRLSGVWGVTYIRWVLSAVR